jgi:hypothetical protein
MNKKYRVWTHNDKNNVNRWGVHIIDGKFKDVVVEILTFTSNDHEDGSTLGDLLESNTQVNLSIEFQVIHNPNNIGVDEFENKQFYQFVSDILTEVIKETKEIYDKQNRILNIEESDLRRDVH